MYLTEFLNIPKETKEA